jgi:hypothetical protein
MNQYYKRWFAFFMMLIGCAVLIAQPGTAPQYQVKAVFLYNFTQFVEWPASAFANANAPFVIGVLGENVFGNYLEEAVRNEKINGRPIVVIHYTDPAEIKNCHMLFINSKEANKADLPLSSLKDRGILTVSDADYFVSRGGIVAFFNENNKIRFRINLEAAKEANLKFSSKILRVAQIAESKL